MRIQEEVKLDQFEMHPVGCLFIYGCGAAVNPPRVHRMGSLLSTLLLDIHSSSSSYSGMSFSLSVSSLSPLGG